MLIIGVEVEGGDGTEEEVFVLLLNFIIIKLQVISRSGWVLSRNIKMYRQFLLPGL